MELAFTVRTPPPTQRIRSSNRCPSACQSSPNSQQPVSRRVCLRHLAHVVALTSLSLDSKPAGSVGAPKETIINSVLSAYGLPTVSDKRGFTLLSMQYGRLVVQFEHPSAWVVTSSSPNSSKPLMGRASGLTAADYRRAEGLSFFVSSNPAPARNIKDVPPSFIADLVTPGDATGNSPEVSIVRVTDDNSGNEGVNESNIGFRIIDTTYESTTVSGYTVGRRARTRATVLSDGRLYALNASCTATRWKKMEDDLDASLQSFRVFIL